MPFYNAGLKGFLPDEHTLKNSSFFFEPGNSDWNHFCIQKFNFQHKSIIT